MGETTKSNQARPTRHKIGGIFLNENHDLSAEQNLKTLQAESEGWTGTSDGWEDNCMNSITNFVATDLSFWK